MVQFWSRDTLDSRDTLALECGIGHRPLGSAIEDIPDPATPQSGQEGAPGSLLLRHAPGTLHRAPYTLHPPQPRAPVVRLPSHTVDHETFIQRQLPRRNQL